MARIWLSGGVDDCLQMTVLVIGSGVLFEGLAERLVENSIAEDEVDGQQY